MGALRSDGAISGPSKRFTDLVEGGEQASRRAVRRRFFQALNVCDTPERDPSGVTGEAMAAVTAPPGEVTGLDTGVIMGEPVTAVLTRHIERLEAELAELRGRVSNRDVIVGQLDGLRVVLDEVRRDRDRWHEAATARRSWWPWRRSA